MLVWLAATNAADVVRMFYKDLKDERDFFSGKNRLGYRVAPDDCVVLLQVICDSTNCALEYCESAYATKLSMDIQDK